MTEDKFVETIEKEFHALSRNTLNIETSQILVHLRDFVLKEHEEDKAEWKQKLQQFFEDWENCELWCTEQGEACCFPKTCSWRGRIDKLKGLLR